MARRYARASQRACGGLPCRYVPMGARRAAPTCFFLPSHTADSADDTFALAANYKVHAHFARAPRLRIDPQRGRGKEEGERTETQQGRQSLVGLVRCTRVCLEVTFISPLLVRIFICRFNEYRVFHLFSLYKYFIECVEFNRFEKSLLYGCFYTYIMIFKSLTCEGR